MLAKRVIRTVLFCTIFVILLHSVYQVLSWKDTAGGYGSTVNSFYKLDEDLVDVLFLGSSHCYCSINNSILWKNYGIASFNLAISGQELVNTYHTMVEALKTQKPDVVCVELFYALSEGDYVLDSNFYRNVLPFRLSANSYEAVRAMVNEDEPLDYWLKWPIIHTRYAELQKEDFESDLPVYIGYQAEFRIGDTWEASPYQGQEPIPASEESELYIRKIIELAEEEGIELCFFVAPYAAGEEAQGVFNYVAGIAEEHDVDFLNLTRPIEGLSLDLNSDYIDWGHTNYYGAEKVTSYMGEYLHSNYTLPDRRGDDRYGLWEEDALARQHEYQNQQLFLQTADIRSYLDLAGSMDGYTFFIFTVGEYVAEDVDISNHLEWAGIGEEYYDGHHMWVISDKKRVYVSEEDDFLHYSDLTRDEYVVSGVQGKLSLFVDRTAYGVVQDGFNIVVYDNVLGRVVDSIGFQALQQYAPVR